MTLPQTKQSRASQQVTPLDARVMVAGMPKAGKTTLAAGWAPDSTLMIDTHKGTTLLDGEHYVEHVADWAAFERVVNDLTTVEHDFKTVVIDLIDDVWKMADRFAAEKKGQVAAGLIEYGKGTAEAEGLFRREVGKLFAASVGIWFLSHTDTEENGQITRYVPRLDKRVRTYVSGACQFVLLAETLGPKRVLHTQPSARFEAGSRVPLPEPMDLDARVLYAAMSAGLNAGVPAVESVSSTESTSVSGSVAA